MIRSDADVLEWIAFARKEADAAFAKNKQHSWHNYGQLAAVLEDVNKERLLFKSWFLDDKGAEHGGVSVVKE